VRPGIDPDPFQEIAYPNALRAKLAISDLLGRPLARLSDEEREWINGVLAETLGHTKPALIATSAAPSISATGLRRHGESDATPAGHA
jgi:hypothetical protein